MAEDKFQRGRLKTDPSPAMVNYVIRPGLELALKRYYQAFLDCNKAHVLMLAKQNIIAKDVAKAILAVNVRRHLKIVQIRRQLLVLEAF